MTAKLQILDGRVVVADEYICSEQPRKIVHHWPADLSASDVKQNWPNWIGRELQKGNPGVYSIRIGDGPFSGWARIQLTQLGQTESIKTDVLPIDPPKVRKGTETRWNRGRWEKYLKSRGWVPA